MYLVASGGVAKRKEMLKTKENVLLNVKNIFCMTNTFTKCYSFIGVAKSEKSSSLDNVASILMQLLAPILAVLLTIYLGQAASNLGEVSEPRLNLDLSVYGKTTVFVSKTSDPLLDKVAKFYQSTAASQKGNVQFVDSVSEGKIFLAVSLRNVPVQMQNCRKITTTELASCCPSFDRGGPGQL